MQTNRNLYVLLLVSFSFYSILIKNSSKRSSIILIIYDRYLVQGLLFYLQGL
jgi:hypothetical protein